MRAVAPKRSRSAPQAVKPWSFARVVRRVLAWGLALAVLLAVGGWGAWLWVDARLPPVFTFDQYARSVPQVTRVLDADGTVIDELFVERRTVVPLGALPRHLRLAVIAAEDADFLRHRGLDPLGIARALLRDLAEGRLAQGGSTITQQVARTFYLSAEKTLSRKLREAVLAIKLERELTKDAILALYLNQIYFGHGRWGVQEAARYYFGKDVQGVDLAEAALLAGVVQSPGRLSPFVAPEAARRRRRYVLEQMIANGLVEPAAARLAMAAPLPAAPGATLPSSGGYFVDAVRRELLTRLSPGAILRGGLRVRTTLDLRLQGDVEAAVAEGLRGIDQETGVWASRPQHGAGSGRLAELRAARRLRPARPGQVVPAVVRSVDQRRGAADLDLGGSRARLELADLERRYAPGRSSSLRPGDELAVRLLGEGDRVWPELGPQAAVVALDPRSGAVRALVGGESFETHPFNRAVQARRQPGSTFKLFVYAAGLVAGAIRPDGNIELPRRGWSDGRGGTWWPGGGEAGETLGVTDAFARSSNVAAVALLRAVGVATVKELAHRMGVRSPLGVDLTLALGSSDVTVMELTQAYGTVAAGGLRLEPRLVEAVIDPAGRNVWPSPPAAVRALPSDVAASLGRMLRAVVQGGTGTAAAIEGMDVAGKTGTSDDGRDSWFVGYVPGLVVGVWIGRDDHGPVPGASGGRFAAPLFRRVVSGDRSLAAGHRLEGP